MVLVYHGTRMVLGVIDAHKPDNLVETAYYDTWDDIYIAHTSYHGAWGAFPYTDNNLVYVSDIENGLFILDVDYVRASYLEGNILIKMVRLYQMLKSLFMEIK